MTPKSGGMIVVFLGAPGAGKGTQAASVAEAMGLKHISSGDMFRRAVERSDDLGRTVRGYMEKGALVPDEITTRMVLDELKGSARGIILDGFPRNLNQAVSLDQALRRENRAVDRVVYIRVEQDELLRRLSSRWLCNGCQSPYTHTGYASPAVCPKCGGQLYQRTDDQPETVHKRLAVYFKETAPLIDYYHRQGKLSEVEGQGEVGDITQRINAALKGKA
jgi:adenylate kinase